MATYEFWAHGNATRAQREGYFINKLHSGAGAVFRTHGAEWFHIVVPTPAKVSGVSLKVNRVSVFFKTLGTSRITAIDLYDGIRRAVEIRKNLPVSGDHSAEIEVGQNTWEFPSPDPDSLPPPIHVKFGLGISVRVDFGPPTQAGVPEINFVAAGARFVS